MLNIHWARWGIERWFRCPPLRIWRPRVVQPFQGCLPYKDLACLLDGSAPRQPYHLKPAGSCPLSYRNPSDTEFYMRPTPFLLVALLLPQVACGTPIGVAHECRKLAQPRFANIVELDTLKYRRNPILDACALRAICEFRTAPARDGTDCAMVMKSSLV